MVNQKTLDYIEQKLKQGASREESREEIRNTLLANGLSAPDIEEAVGLINLPNFTPPVNPNPITPSSETPPYNNLPTSVFSSTDQKPKGINKKFLALFLILGILLVSSAAFGYFIYFQSPEKNVQKMIARLSEVKSLEYSGEIKASGQYFAAPSATNEKQGDFSIKFSGLSDVTDLNDVKSSFSLDINTNVLSKEQSNFKIETISIGKILYVKLSEVPSLVFFGLSSIKNQWIEINSEDLKNQSGIGIKQVEEMKRKLELSPQQTNEIRVAFKQAKIFKITEKLSSEKIEGVNTFHYKFAIDKEGVKKLFLRISEIVQSEKTLSSADLSEFNSSLEKIQMPEGEIWIGKKDLLPYKISLSSIIKETGESKTSGNFSITLLLKNFNKPVQIETPAPVKKFKEVINEVYGKFNQQDIQQNLGKDSDGDELPDQIETMYGTDLNNPDTDGDSYKDGAEIKNGYNPNGPGKLFE